MELRYWKRYLRFIEMCDGQTYNDLYYYENHHIVPRCLGGDNTKDNLIKLTARQHFLAHILLVKAIPEDQCLYYAVHRMRTSPQQANHLTSKEVEWAREVYSVRPITEETRKRMSLARKGKKLPKISERNKKRTGLQAFRTDHRLLWFFNTTTGQNIYCTRLQAKQLSYDFFQFSSVSSKRLYLGQKENIKGWTCMSCFL